MKDLIQKFFMGLGATFFIGVLFPEFRIWLGKTVSYVLDPLLVLPIHVVILLLATITAVYSTLIQKYTIDFKRMKEIQQKIMEFQKKYRKAVKENNQFLIKQLEKQKDEINALQTELMNMNFRSLFYSLVVTIPIWVWLWYRIYDIAEHGYTSLYGGVSSFMITVPFKGEIHVSDTVLFFLPWWLFWYIICSILISQVIKKVVRLGW